MKINLGYEWTYNIVTSAHAVHREQRRNDGGDLVNGGAQVQSQCPHCAHSYILGYYTSSYLKYVESMCCCQLRNGAAMNKVSDREKKKV